MPRLPKGVAFAAYPWVTLFLDLLGYSKKLRDLDLACAQLGDNPKELYRRFDATITRIKIAQMAVAKMFGSRRSLTALPGFQEKLKGMKGAEKALTIRRARPVFVVRSFGDSFVVSLACPKDKRFGFKIALSHIFQMFTYTSATFLQLLGAGIPLLGAIEIGWGSEYVPYGGGRNEPIAASLAKAYCLESKKADYPRVMIGPELVEYMLGLVRGAVEGHSDPLTRLYAAMALQQTRQDPDGSISLHYLEKDIAGERGAVAQSAILDAQRFITTSLAQARESKADRLIGMYGKTQAYFDSVLSSPGSAPRPSPAAPSGTPPGTP